METPDSEEKKNIPKRRARLTPAGKEKKRLADEEKKKIKSTETADTGVSTEEELSDEELMKKIDEALASGDMDKIRDVLIDVLKKENKGGSLADYNSDDEMKKHLQEKLQEYLEKENKEERAEISPIVETVAEEVPKEGAEISEEDKAKENEAHEKAMEDKEMLYSTKINLMEDDANKDTKEVKKELLRTVEYVNKEKVKENCATKINELIKLSYKEEAQKKEGEGKTEYENKIEELAKEMNIPPEEIQAIMTTQKANLEELTYQQEKKKKSKKESKWKKIKRLLPKIVLYGGAAVLGITTGGAFGVAIGIGMSVTRITETIFKGKKGRKAREEAIAESKKMLLEETDGTAEISEEEKEEKEEKNDLIERFYDDIFIKLSIAKQNQINGKEKENSELGVEIQIFEDEEYKPNDEKSKKEMKKLYTKRRELHKEQITKYLEEQGVVGEELDKRVKLSAQLIEMEDNQKIMELDFTKRKVGVVGKIFAGLDSVLSHSLLLGGPKGGEQTKEKLITISVFAVAGALARACPIVRNILMAYAGMKLGSLGADWIIGKSKKFTELKQVSAESINLNSNMDDISRAKAQLLDPKFKENNPVEHAKLQEKIFAIDRAKLDEFLGKKEDNKKGYVEGVNEALEESIKKRLKLQKSSKIIKYGLGIAGGVAGWLVGDYMGDKMKERKEEAGREATGTAEKDPNVIGDGKETSSVNLDEEMRKAEEELAKEQAELAKLQAEAERLAELNKTVIVEKGDTSWSLAENGARNQIGHEKWDNMPQHQQDYVTDWYKDKMVATPDLIGIEGGDASSLRIGDELNIAKLFSDPDEMTRAIGKAQGLSPEAIKNIMANREIIGNVMSQKLENVSGDNLIKVMNIMGGTEQSGAGFVQELQNRATEMIGANASPEQVQTILHNPSLFGEIMRSDGNLTEVHNNVLHKCFELINGNEDMTIGELQRTVIDQDSPLSEELWARLKDLNNDLGAQFGDKVGINEIGSIGGLNNTPVGQEFGETMKGIAERVNEYGDKLAKLSEKTGFFDKLFGAEGKMEKVSALYKGAVEDFQANVASQQEFINESADLAKTYTDLTGGKFLQHAVLNYAEDQAKDIKNIAGKIVEFNKILNPSVDNNLIQNIANTKIPLSKYTVTEAVNKILREKGTEEINRHLH